MITPSFLQEWPVSHVCIKHFIEKNNQLYYVIHAIFIEKNLQDINAT